MKRLHIIGRKNHGKTTLMVELVRELTGRGLCVGTVKHSSHSHQLDTPGKDSFRHAQAGAIPAAIVTSDLIGVYVPRQEEADFYDQLAPMFAACDLVLVEGHADCADVKIEVWRAALDGDCLATHRSDIAAVVTDDPLQIDLPVWPRGNLPRLADRVVALIHRIPT